VTIPEKGVMAALNYNAYRTHSGAMLDLSQPEEIVFSVADIAHHLARVCRYGGAVDEFYSVASHCVYICRELRSRGYPADVQAAGLLHDAAEAFIGDMVSGLKRMMPEFRALERRYAATIEQQFGVHFDGNPTIKDADLRARLAEVRDLFHEVPYPREQLLGGEGLRRPYETWCVVQTPDEAEWDYMAEARRLGLFP
jgi:uncharacterized protein